MDPQKQSIIDRIKQANNILVTVSKNPSVDQLAAAIGYTLALNKVGKHAIAVFSGQVPSTIEFLKPEETFEKTTDSLRDFIISLDKAKADKLRYKVEDEHVKIFITPYRTSLSEKDLEFSQGDFNVEVIVALGVIEQQDLDDAITAQGRILHDATVVDINTGGNAKLGTLIWSDPKASSLCEMVMSLAEPMKANLFDAQMSTAFLTGIVAETDRFSNEKTSPATMQASSKLMAAGANQQLVATQLQPPKPPEDELPPPVDEPPTPPAPEAPAAPANEPEPAKEEKTNADGALEIAHGDELQVELPIEGMDDEEKEEEISQIHIDDQGKLRAEDEEEPLPPSQISGRGMTLQPPTLGGQLTANSEPEHEHLEPSVDILGEGAAAPTGPILSHQPAGGADAPQTLASLEEAVHSPHLTAARDAVEAATPEPTHDEPTEPTMPSEAEIINPIAPPPVPPPMMPPNFMPPSDSSQGSL